MTSTTPPSEEPFAATPAWIGKLPVVVQAPVARRELQWRGFAPNVRGALLVLGSAILFTSMATLAKHLGESLNFFQVVFFRTLVGLLFVLPFLANAGMDAVRTTKPGLHTLRGVMGNTAMILGFYALIHLPLADANAISFARALFLVPLAIVFLGETVGARRISATAVGFLGVLIMLRPTGTIEPAAMAAVGQSVFVAATIVCVKILSRTDRPVTLLFYSGVFGLIITALPAWYVWQAPSLWQLGLLVLMGALGVSAQTCFVNAYRVGEATALAPFDYTRLLFAAIAGLLFFGDVPDAYTLAGAAIIVAATLYIGRREAKLGKEVTPAAGDMGGAAVPIKKTGGEP